MVAVANPPIPLLTADDLLAMPSSDSVRYELWRGRLVEMSPAGGPHPWIGLRLLRALDAATITSGVGEIWSFDAGFRLETSPDTVVAPDLALVPATYVANITVDSEGYHPIAPPLVIEIKSPSDREAEIAEKLALYLGSGIGEVWWVRPKQRTITRHWPDRDPIVLGPDDTLTDVEAIPGVTISLAELFASPVRTQ